MSSASRMGGSKPVTTPESNRYWKPGLRRKFNHDNHGYVSVNVLMFDSAPIKATMMSAKTV